MDKQLYNELIEVLSEIIPKAKAAYGFLKILYKIGFKQNLEYNLVQNLAKEISEEIYDSKDLDKGNKGAAKAACYDILLIIRRTKIDAKFLIDNKLNEKIIISKLLENGQDVISTASSIRNSIINYGLKVFTQKLIDNAMEIPKINLELTKFMIFAAENHGACTRGSSL